MEDTESETGESNDESSDIQSRSENINDEDEVFIPTDVDRELLLVSRCCCHARRMRFNNFDP